jgi:hypothetical protein
MAGVFFEWGFHAIRLAPSNECAISVTHGHPA